MRRRACCHALPRPPFCTCGGDWHKHWVAGTFSPIGQLACSCDHPAGAHQQIAGVRTESSQFFSRSTAEYPKNLLNHLVRLFCHYFQIGSWNLIWITLSTICQSNRLMTPFLRQDGAGFHTRVPDILSRIVAALSEKKSFLEHRLDAKMNHHFPQNNFDLLKLSWMSFYLHKGSNQIGQFPVINNFEQLCSCMQDPDTCFLT